MPQATQEQSEPNEEPLESRQVLLPRPIFSYDFEGYYEDALKTHAPQIVDLLAQIRDHHIDRTEHPELASFLSERVSNDLSFEKAFNQAVARAVVDLAQGAGIRVEFTVHGVTYGRKLPNQVSSSTAITSAPDFRLKITSDFDKTTYGPDFRKDTWSYKGLINKIAVVIPSTLGTPQ